MGPVDRSPLVEELQDCFFFPRQDRVDRPAARLAIGQAARMCTLFPTPRPDPVQLEKPAHSRDCPAACDGFVDECDECFFHGSIDTRWDRAV